MEKSKKISNLRKSQKDYSLAFKLELVDQVEKGYFLNDKIIRFAKVVVGK